MKLIPHNKNVGLVFFGVLILGAIFLFVSDKFGSKSPTPDPSPKERGETAAQAQGRIALADNASASFNQVDWQSSLSDVNAGVSAPSDGPALNISPDSKPKSLRSYAAALKNALRRYSDPGLANEFSIMVAVSDAQDDTRLSEIDGLEALHQATLADLIAVSVPADVAVYHAQIVNAVQAITVADKNMKLVLTTPDVAIAAGRAYQADTKSFYSALTKISAHLLSRGVVLPKNEQLQVYLNVEK